MSVSDVMQSYGLGAERAQSLLNASKVVDAFNKAKDYNQGTVAQGNLGGGISIGKGAGKMGIGINTGVGTDVHANNNKNYGETSQSISEQDYNEALRGFNNIMQTIAQSDKNDESTQWSKQYTDTLNESDRLSQDKALYEREAKSYQESMARNMTYSIGRNQNLNSEFKELAREKYGLTESEAGKLLFSSKEEDQTLKSSLMQEITGRQFARNNMNLMPNMRQESAKLGRNDLDFSKSDLEADYQAKEQIKQKGIDKFDGEMETKIAERKQRREEMRDKMDVGLGHASEEISKGKENITAKKEQIKQSVKTRAKDGAFWRAGKELWKTTKDMFGNKEED
jgi:hypothetical protein